MAALLPLLVGMLGDDGAAGGLAGLADQSKQAADLSDDLTPTGLAPLGGFGNTGDLIGRLDGMLQKT